MKQGGQPGNRNALKNGSKSLKRLALGQLSGPLIRVTRGIQQYRRSLEEAIRAKRPYTMTDDHLINAACTWEQHAAVCMFLIRETERKKQLTTADLANIRESSRQIAQARDARNRAFMALRIDTDLLQDAIDALYAPVSIPAIIAEAGIDVPEDEEEKTDELATAAK
jgi:hypothetical protein